jgi:hypothetical protein
MNYSPKDTTKNVMGLIFMAAFFAANLQASNADAKRRAAHISLPHEEEESRNAGQDSSYFGIPGGASRNYYFTAPIDPTLGYSEEQLAESYIKSMRARQRADDAMSNVGRDLGAIGRAYGMQKAAQVLDNAVSGVVQWLSNRFKGGRLSSPTGDASFSSPLSQAQLQAAVTDRARFSLAMNAQHTANQQAALNLLAAEQAHIVKLANSTTDPEKLQQVAAMDTVVWQAHRNYFAQRAAQLGLSRPAVAPQTSESSAPAA